MLSLRWYLSLTCPPPKGDCPCGSNQTLQGLIDWPICLAKPPTPFPLPPVHAHIALTILPFGTRLCLAPINCRRKDGSQVPSGLQKETPLASYISLVSHFDSSI